MNEKLTLLLGVHLLAIMRRKFFMSHLTLSHAIVNSHLCMPSHGTEAKLSMGITDSLGIQLFLNLPGTFSSPPRSTFTGLPTWNLFLKKLVLLSGQIKSPGEEREKKPCLDINCKKCL